MFSALMSRFMPYTTASRRPYHGTNGSDVLSLVLLTQPQVLQDALDEYIATVKHSKQSVKAAEKLDLLLKHDASPNEYSHDGKTPLSKAIEFNRPWLLKRLEQTRGFVLDRANQLGSRPIETAIFRGNTAIFGKLLGGAGSIRKETLQWAAECGRVEMFISLVKERPDLINREEQEYLIRLAHSQ